MSLIQWFADLPVWLAWVLVTGGAFLLTLVGTAFARLTFGDERLNLNNIVGGFKYMFLSNVYAGFLGFLLFGVYDRFDQVRAGVINEVSALTTLDRLASTWPPATRDQLRASLRDYALAVASFEWPQLAMRNGSSAALASLDDLDAVYNSVEAASRKQREVLTFSRELLTEVRNTREARILRSTGSLPALLWGVALLGTLVSIVLPWVFGTPNIKADLGMSALGIVLMVSIVIVILRLSYPFGGSEGISPQPFLAFAEAR